MKKEDFEIYLLSKNYRFSKRIIKEVESNQRVCNPCHLQNYRLVVSRIENSLDVLDPNERFIIQNEVLEGKTGDWYQDFFSVPSYYRHRKKAYEEFLRCLNC